MLSVKWIYENDGLEVQRIFEAESVTAGFYNGTPDRPTKAGETKQLMGRDIENGLLIVGDGLDLADRSIDCGKVYVMNQSGKTVASYDLGYPAFGVGSDSLCSAIADARGMTDDQLTALPYERAADLRRTAREVGSGDVIERLNRLGVAVNA